MHPKQVSVKSTLLSLEHLFLTGLPGKEWKELICLISKKAGFLWKKVKTVFPSNISDSFYTDLKW